MSASIFLAALMTDQPSFSKLRKLITEGLRVQRGNDPVKYINVGHAVEDASARQNHVIFARRGCGKTLLLHDSATKLPDDIRPIYLNCEDFKQHTFPNVLIEILKSLFAELDKNLVGWFGRKKATKAIIGQVLARLKSMHHAPDVQEEAVKHTSSDSIEGSSDIGLDELGLKLKLQGASKEEVERSYTSHRKKLQELDHWLPDLKSSLREFFTISSNVKSILLQIDDLYHLKRADQAFVVDYVHRLCKDLPIYFKIATMRHASTLYMDRGGQPIGAQERHDYQSINIDYTFSDFKRTEKQNWDILKQYGSLAGMESDDLQNLFKGEGFSRLVMAGGGVPRDVLSLFLEAMSESEGSAIGKDEVRQLSRSNLERRIEELKHDAQVEEQNGLISGIYVLRKFCLDKKTNVFLVPEQVLQKNDLLRSLFYRLVDYRIIHQAGSALTHKSQAGNFQAFAIDIGCYAHLRKMEGRFNEIDVSKTSSKDQMRSAPVLTEPELISLLKSAPPEAEAILKAEEPAS